MRLEDRLEGDSDFAGWKFRLKLLLKEHGLNKFIENSDPPPKGNNELEKWESDNNKAMKLIVDGVKTHLLPVISELDTTHEMYNALGNMFEINNDVRIITLKDRMSNIKLNKGEKISSYFMRIIEL